MPPPPFMSNGYFDNTIQDMFDLSNKTFVAMYNKFDQRHGKQYEIFNQLRETKFIENYKHLDTNLQAMFAQSSEKFG